MGISLEDFSKKESTFTADNTTLAFACWSWGTTRSQICSLSPASSAVYRESVFKTATRPHSEHSFRAMRSLLTISVVMGKVSLVAPAVTAAA